MLELTPELVRHLRSAQAKAELKTREKIAARRRGRAMHADRMRVLAARVSIILRAGEPTKFQFEAACRHGLRIGLIKQGWNWADADQAATDVVVHALKQIGAIRPTWYEGQPEHTGNHSVDRFFCERCGAPLDEDRHKYCSKLCSNAAHKDRAAKFGLQVSLAQYHAVLAERREDRLKACSGECESCGRPFIASQPGVRFCSRICVAKARVVHPPKPCRQCGTIFKPVAQGAGRSSDFCSRACKAAAQAKARPSRPCDGCGADVRPKYEGDPRRFCSIGCRYPAKASPITCEATE